MNPFLADLEALHMATEMLAPTSGRPAANLPAAVPKTGVGPIAALEHLAPIVLDGARDLGAPGFFAHMDPPTPWITWAVSQWTASRNQNLLHPDVAPTARELERTVLGWFAPLFGMDGGHMTPGSTIANLTALWAARETGCTEVVTTANAHLSVKKSAHILGMGYREVEWERPGDLSSAVAVITAGCTSTGEIEPLDAAPGARWRHVDAAWSGPLRLSPTHRHLLDSIESADSVAVSAHKWLFQPKESALVMFTDTETAHASISLDGAYLAVPNVGVLGSHGATAVPLAATVLAYGLDGVSSWIDQSMALADRLHTLVVAHPELEARSTPLSGVLNWRRTDQTIPELDDVFVSTTVIDGQTWLRSVAANPMADPELVVSAVVDRSPSPRSPQM
ncbi:MAG: pyridoxal phosphate-dependent decarboxylase family protein [Acidimicrobiales bacterium]